MNEPACKTSGWNEKTSPSFQGNPERRCVKHSLFIIKKTIQHFALSKEAVSSHACDRYWEDKVYSPDIKTLCMKNMNRGFPHSPFFSIYESVSWKASLSADISYKHKKLFLRNFSRLPKCVFSQANAKSFLGSNRFFLQVLSFQKRLFKGPFFFGDRRTRCVLR